MRPISAPHSSDWAARLRGFAWFMLSLVTITGFRINRTPSSRVMKVEKLPMAWLGIRLASQLPARVKQRTLAIITRPFLMSRFLFLP